MHVVVHADDAEALIVETEQASEPISPLFPVTTIVHILVSTPLVFYSGLIHVAPCNRGSSKQKRTMRAQGLAS